MTRRRQEMARLREEQKDEVEEIKKTLDDKLRTLSQSVRSLRQEQEGLKDGVSEGLGRLASEVTADVEQALLYTRRLAGQTEATESEIEALQQQLQRSERQLEQTRTQLTEVQNLLETSKAQLADSQQEATAKQGQLSRSEREVGEMKAKLSEAERREAEVRSELSRAEAGLEEAEGRLTEAKKKYEAGEETRRAELEARDHAHKQERERQEQRLEQQLRQLQQQLDAKLQLHTQETGELQAQLLQQQQHYQTQVQDAQRELQEAQRHHAEKLRELDNDKSRHKVSHSDGERELKTCQDKANKLKEERDWLAQEEARWIKQAAQLRGQLEQEAEKVGRLETEKLQLLQDSTRVRERDEELEADLRRLTGEKDRAEAAHRGKVARMEEELQEVKAVFQRSVASLQQQVDSQCRSATDSASQDTEQLQKSRAEVATLQAQLKNYSEALEQTQAELKSREDLSTQLQGELEDMRRQLEEKLHQLSSGEEQLSEATQELEDTREQLARCRQDLEEYDGRFRDQEHAAERAAALQQELTRCTALLGGKSAELADTTLQHAQLQHQYTLCRADKQEFLKNLEECQRILGQCQTERSQLVKKLSASQRTVMSGDQAVVQLRGELDHANTVVANLEHQLGEQVGEAERRAEQQVAELRRHHQQEKQDLIRRVEQLTKALSDSGRREGAGGGADMTFQMLRAQYLEAVNTIRSDVLKYAGEVNKRAAQVVKQEVAKEREATAVRLKEQYLCTLQQILADISSPGEQDKMSAMSDALESALSTPRSVGFEPPPHPASFSVTDPFAGRGDTRSLRSPSPERKK